MKINITLDVSKINKEKITPREYINKDGVAVLEKNYKMELVPLNEKKFVAEGDTWVMYKTHFVAEGLTKEEKQQKIKGTIVGSGFQFEEKNPTNTEEENEKIRALKAQHEKSATNLSDSEIPW